MRVVSGWLGRIIAIQERRPHRVLVCLSIVAFVSIVRLLLEWTVGHRPLQAINLSFLGFVSFYLLVLFLYTVPIALLVRQPWRQSMNVVMAAVLLGVVPPLIDGLASGIGSFVYEYIFDFPAAWPWTLYAPRGGLPLGEAVVLWVTIALSVFYVWRKTSSPARALAAGLLAYGIVVLVGGVVPTALARMHRPSGWWFEEGRVMTFGQLALTLVAYLGLQRGVALGLLRRSLHAAPFILVCLIGAALKGPIDSNVAWYAALLFLASLVALAQNDHFDREEDARQGRPAYLDAEDVHLLNAIFLLCILTLLASNSVMGYILLFIFVVSVLYSYPLYRAKRFFPANLKIEGVWGASSFLVGVSAAIDREHPLGLENLAYSQEALGHSARIAAAFDPPTITALALAFGGWSLVAALKDYKDIRADARAGIQTVYTLAVRRAWGLRRVHRSLTLAVALSMLLPFALLAWVRDWPMAMAAGGLPFAAALLWAASRGPSRAGFQVVLASINLHLLTVLAALLLDR